MDEVMVINFDNKARTFSIISFIWLKTFNFFIYQHISVVDLNFYWFKENDNFDTESAELQYIVKEEEDIAFQGRKFTFKIVMKILS